MSLFFLIALLLTSLTVALVAWPLVRHHTSQHRMVATLTGLSIPGLAIGTYLLVSNYVWQSPSTEFATDPLQTAVTMLQKKLELTPESEEGWLLLGTSYLRLSRPVDAVKAYQRALDLSGGDNFEARLGLAESRFILDPESLSGSVGTEIEALLAAQPKHPKGLWYGGWVSFARGQPAQARARWEALLAQSPPPRVREIIETQLAALAGREPVAGPELASASASDSAPIRVSVTVSLKLREWMVPGAPLFIFVRDSQGGGPPLAVLRRSASELPMTVEIGAADSMLPGQDFSALKGARLVARIANGGNPLAQPGGSFWEVNWLRAASPTPVSIVIDQVVAAEVVSP